MRFRSYHPAVNLIFFAVVLYAAVAFNQPIFLVLSYACAFVYSVWLNGKRALGVNLALVLLILLFTLFYSYYNHFGVTNLAINVIGNQITLEAVVTGAWMGTMAATVLMWLACFYAVVSADKVVYLFSRLSPRLSLYFSIALRMAPRVYARAKTIYVAQKCIGRGMGQGNLLRRARNCLRVFSIVVTWTMESLVQAAESMKSRGYSLRGRTAFSIYRFDYRDRTVVMAMFCCLTAIVMGVLFDQTRVSYDPVIEINRVTPLSCVFYAAYALFCLLPMLLEIAGNIRFSRCRCAAFGGRAALPSRTFTKNGLQEDAEQ